MQFRVNISPYFFYICSINKIKFEMRYQTQMGQEVGVIGSLDALGKWNQNKVLRLNWKNGNIWNKEI